MTWNRTIFIFIFPSIDDWKPIEIHGITAVIDLDGDLDLGIPSIPNHILYVYFPIRDEELPDLNKLHALAQLGARLVANGEKLLAHSVAWVSIGRRDRPHGHRMRGPFWSRPQPNRTFRR